MQLNGPELTYASEKLDHALYKAAEGARAVRRRAREVIEEVHGGHAHGAWLKEEV